jgi:sulfite reductase (NADPH) flavoprotein alpha-component
MAIRPMPCSFSVLALGDSNYEHFCKFGRDLDEKLASLGAFRMCERVDCDVDTDEPFTRWRSLLFKSIEQIVAARPAQRSGSNVEKPATEPLSASQQEKRKTPAHSRDNPFLASIVEKRPLTREVSTKLTLHMALSVEGSAVTYEAGDACAVIPQNEPGLVEEILHKLKFSADVLVQVPKAGTVPLQTALLDHLQITRLTRKMVQAYATVGSCAPLLDLLRPEQQSHLDAYTWDRGLIDLLYEFPNVLRDPADLVAMLPKLSPRLYSISSSPAAHAGQIHTTVAVVRYRSHNRERGGVCSTMFADRAHPAGRLPIYIQPNNKFRLPKDSDRPIIMIGPGTGIAPFRSFLHERRALGASGKNWLFFGERSAAADFLYREELESLQKDQFLTRLDLAFSRDQDHKIYVQDKMLEQAPLFWSWLQEGACVYVCGDATRMAKDVDAMLHTIVEQQGNLNREASVEYIQNLKDQHRYHRDVY